MRHDAFSGCCNPVAMALLGDGRVVTAEKGLERVSVYRERRVGDAMTGVLEAIVAPPDRFPGEPKICVSTDQCQSCGPDVAVDARGRVLVLLPCQKAVWVFAPIAATVGAAP